MASLDAPAPMPTPPLHRAPLSLHPLAAGNAMAQCAVCNFVPCLCPPLEDAADDALHGDVQIVRPDEEEATSIEAVSSEESSAEAPDCDHLGRVRLPTGSEDLGGDADREIWIAQELRPHLHAHQIDGVRFMFEHLMADRGCILADYMGLGKTLQVITVLHAFMTERSLQCNGSAACDEELSDGRVDGQSPTAMVLCPAICIPNWVAEFNKWLRKDSLAKCPLVAFDATVAKGTAALRLRLLKQWKRDGGVLIMGYEMFRSMLNPAATASLDRDRSIQVCTRISTSTMEVTTAIKSQARQSSREFTRLLCEPGADVIVLDEGHRMKDPTSLLCQSVSKIRSKRRLVLTGYPVQNSLGEYWCMVNFARPEYLGSYEAFRSQYEKPILAGQTAKTVELVDKLRGVVLRRGKALLDQQLPPKREWILYCKLSPIQHRLYCDYLRFCGDNNLDGCAATDLLSSYAMLLQVMNHPDIIHMKISCADNDMADESVMGTPQLGVAMDEDGWNWESEETIQERYRSAEAQASKRRQRLEDLRKSYEWATPVLMGDAQTRAPLRRKLAAGDAAAQQDGGDAYQTMLMENSGKMAVLMRIVEESFAVGDKIVIFSQSIPTLQVITAFLQASSLNPAKSQTSIGPSRTPVKKEQRQSQPLRASRRDPAGILRKRKTKKTKTSQQVKLVAAVSNDYDTKWFLQIDGMTSGAKRLEYIKAFSDASSGIKLLLVSTRAGAEGINLHAANRLVLFDVSWNPSNDHQSMCRSHRIGQTKPVHVYRLVSTGTMERLIYEQQTKKEKLQQAVMNDSERRQNSQAGETSPPGTASDVESSTSGFLQPPPDPDQINATNLEAIDVQDDEVLARSIKTLQDWLVDIHLVQDAVDG